MIIRSYLKALALAILILATVLAVRPASAEPRTEVFVFGDSLSDDGNFFALTGGLYPPAPFYYEGRFSDGPVWWEHFAGDLGIPGTGLAVAGAFTGGQNESDGLFGRDYPGLSDQVAAFLAAHPSGVNPDALYVVWAGANDVIRHLELFLATGDASFINPAEPAGNLAAAMTALAQSGARYFLIPSVPNLGVVPRVLEFPAPLQAQVAGLSLLYKGVIDAVLGATAAALGVTVVNVDSFALLTAVSQDPAAYGFTEVTAECLARPDVLDPTTWTLCQFPAPDGWFFWDDLHPSAQGHRFIGMTFADAFREQFCGLDPTSLSGGRADREAPPLWRGVCYRAD